MQYTTLGRTGLRVSRTAFGVLPLQRTPMAEAVPILRNAYEHEINFFDTARAYSDSEEKIGAALGAVREQIVIATKSFGKDAAEIRAHLETSLHNLRTDYVDILQLHNPEALVGEDDPRYGQCFEPRGGTGCVTCRPWWKLRPKTTRPRSSPFH